MDFFEAQEQARKRTKWLVLWFVLAVIGVVVAVDALIFFVVGGTHSGNTPVILIAAFSSMRTATS